MNCIVDCWDFKELPEEKVSGNGIRLRGFLQQQQQPWEEEQLHTFHTATNFC